MPPQNILAPFADIETPGENPPLAFGAESQKVGLRTTISNMNNNVASLLKNVE